MNSKELENYWDNKRQKNVVAYKGRAIPKRKNDGGIGLQEKVQIDVRTMVTPNDAIIQRVLSKHGIVGRFPDETMWNIQRWVVGNISYLGDDVKNYTMEYWQFPFETLADKTGDCEDGAILIASLAINAGIPSYRVRVVAGNVQPSPTAPQGGHAYASYLRESDNQWVIIDWCYFQDSNTQIDKKMLQKTNPYYKNVWFSFNDKYSWSNREILFDSF
jgi:hypothetical protein